ncbi:MAG TPA: endonuclease/exonuclease/phosphatase family protein [Propylenella sp.]|nr:endonuclease/exonuclease/phosphatase family protein [Propylenella sp.]
MRRLAARGLFVGVLLTGLTLLTPWQPALDILNNGLPYLLAGALFVLALALLTRDPRFVLTATLLAAINLVLFVTAYRGAADAAAPGADRFLRIVTFNLWGRSDRISEVGQFLAKTDADAVVLQEVSRRNATALKEAIGSSYPFSAGHNGIVIFSKHPILTSGRLDRPDYPPWISLMLRWARIDIKGKVLDIAGVHLARPFYPELQQEDITGLIQFVQSRTGPHIVAGDFNMSPWTEKLARFTTATGLRRYNTFHLTWPLRRGSVRLIPLVAIDNVFASPHFARIATEGGPRLGSDHRPIIVDLALAQPW